MNCPKCNFEIDEKMLVCPNCKKVLKLVCTKCKTINQGNLCKKCGFSIIVKCHQCGKINQTINGKCNKCNFSTYSSVAISTSNIDEFACLVILFPNINDIKTALGSTKLYDKFKINLDVLINSFAKENSLIREIINDAYVIRFNKDSSFSASANNAVKGSIEILNSITELNFKLNKLKNIQLQCNISVLKRDINSKPEEYRSGFDIKLIYQGKDKNKLLNGLQVVTDSKIYEQVCDNFELSTLSSSFVNGQTVMFFEVNIKKYVKIPEPKEDDEQNQVLAQLPTFDEEIPMENDLYNVDSINFDELSVSFINTDSLNVIPQVLNKLQETNLNLIAIKSGNEHASLTGTLMNKINKLNKFPNLFRVTCNDNMKYEPYGFFRELISGICDFSVAPKNFASNNFEMFNAIDSSNYIQNLINLQLRENANPNEIKNALFDIFFNIFASISGSLIYIEDFDKIDNSSYEILQLFFEKFEELQLSYVITTSKDFSLHKDAHFLLSNRFYTNITVKPTSFKEIISQNVKKYNEILKSYCIEKIAHNFKGSFFYFNQALYYLIDSHYLSLGDDGVFTLASEENIFIPASLDALIAKRLKILSKEKIAYELFAMLLLLGPRIDYGTVKLLNIKDDTLEIQKLVDKGYIYINNNSFYINNYNLYKNNLISTIEEATMQKLANELLSKIFIDNRTNALKSFLYNILKMQKEEIENWENLSVLNNSLSDFNAYLNCSEMLLQLIDENNDETFEKEKKNYKSEIYDNVSMLLNKFSPDRANKVTQMILNNLETSSDTEKTVMLCNKMLQGCLIEGTYSYAFELIHKILSKFSNASINPLNSNFNISFLMLTLVKIEILFSVGNFKDCIESGEEVLNILTPEIIKKIKPEHLSLKQFEEIIFETMVFVAISKIISLANNLTDFIAKLQVNIAQPPEFFSLLLIQEQIIKGKNIENLNDIKITNDKFSKIIMNITKAFSVDKYDYKEFADDCHQAKMSAKLNKLPQIELLCDLLIGYSYFKLNQFKKASTIYNNVLETSIKNGMKLVTYIGWYFIAMLKLAQKDLDVALGIANNAVIQLEKSRNSSDFVLFLFKILLSEMLVAKSELKSANLCLKNAQFIKEKYKLEYKIEEIKESDPEITLESEVQTEEIGDIQERNL